MEISELKKAVHKDLTAQKEKEKKEAIERNSKLSKINLYVSNSNNPQVVQFKKELDAEGIKYDEKIIDDSPKIKYSTQSRGQIIVTINNNKLVIGREFNTSRQLINILQRVAAPDYIQPNAEEIYQNYQKKKMNQTNQKQVLSKKMRKRIEDYNKILPVLEVYRCVQSEGSRFGRPTIAVRTTGCTHRCYFGEGGWCDSWYTSIHPEKGTFSFNDIIKIYDENPQVKEMMLTGGSPTMHPALVNELTHFAHERNILITIETEGSHYIETDFPIGLISLSPKFSNSVPVVGAVTPGGKVVDEKFIKLHNRKRMNTDAIKQMIAFHTDYHYKPVWDGTDKNLKEIEDYRIELNIPKEKTYIMPAGDTRETLIKMYPLVFEMVAEHGYNMTGRDHIIAYDTERGV